ncbi:hypothetical protein WS50_27140 [Burkholderia territorii]|uniref:ShlB/FhaC/HecB family hemolysin secretion/activation protein n=1 Tax=Burkholderia territorii TaxID=1503055 RepID=UPI000752E305|nr:ShlB/FhaC/HecB family hemolysin secretion/activation protein [Burkholderia territorii]KUY85254.1 hypothetical protein WS47_28535 [Burkholderia territorii]KUZ07323.1 hypothetical protein WS50_27140 [Burkholderia territorii]
MSVIQWLKAAVLITALISIGAQAQRASATYVDRAAARANVEKNRQDEHQRDSVMQTPSVAPEALEAETYPSLPSGQPCFRFDRLVLDVLGASPDMAKSLDRFAFTREWQKHYAGQCVSKQGIDVLVEGLSRAIIESGYVTTRVLVPEQDISDGTLTLSIFPGIIRHVRVVDESLRGTWKSAFPTGEGEVLNQYDLEQGLEQMRRVPSQDVSIQIVPGGTPYESDVVLDVRRGKPLTVIASVDNSGARPTGKVQGSLSMSIDNLFGLNDTFNIGVNQDLEFGDKHFGSHGLNGVYSVPWGYWTVTLSVYTNTYDQQIAGVDRTFVASGNSKTIDLKLNRVLSRNQNDVFGAQFRLSRRFGQGFIEDTLMPQQCRNNTFVELGLTDRHYFDATQFDGTLAYRQGIDAFGARDNRLAADGGPTYRYKMTVLDANLYLPFAIAKQSLRYVSAFHGQYTGNTLYFVDDLIAGSRYTVRGFDGETMLAAARGLYWRNELQVPIEQTGFAVYAGLDYGHVWGPKPVALVGAQLVGAVVGVKGNIGTRVGGYSYDLFVGAPVYKPVDFPTARVTLGFQITAQY